jgi:hypothetical protein
MPQQMTDLLGHIVSLLQEATFKDGHPDAQRKRHEAIALIRAAMDALEIAAQIENDAPRRLQRPF